MKFTDFYKDKIVVVTGGGSGLGQAICLNLATCDAIVICTDKDLRLAENTIEIIHSKTQDNNSRAIQLDVTNTKQIRDVITNVSKEFGRIDYMFNNAGITIGGEIRDLNINHWKKVIDVNLFGLISCATEAFKLMSKVKQGHIVNITSISGLLEYTAVSTPYSVSKHGAVSFSKL
ncbi:SDR family NAD(P)-dependent oxidoreductase [Saccharicrinis sp. FJH62]|uniref:SDR family NAD(P)-dependent oxidoreductase n=1 Tax=Saccharicrinis sp. FJH62 TaxID=3344657 RepID=UPI0035D475A7